MSMSNDKVPEAGLLEGSMEERVMRALGEKGAESFDLRHLAEELEPVRGALQRLRRKGLAEVVRRDDGTWVWVPVVPPE